jgi:hypothetical protein
MQAVYASLPVVAGRLCLSGITQALSGSILQSPPSMIRNPFRHKWRYGLKTNSHGSNLIRRTTLSRAAGAKMPNQAMQRTADRPYCLALRACEHHFSLARSLIFSLVRRHDRINLAITMKSAFIMLSRGR